MMNKKTKILILLILSIIFFSFNTNRENIKLRLKFNINQKLEYVVKETSIGNKNYPKFNYKKLTEYKIRFKLKSIDKDKNLNFDFKQLYFYKRDSSYSKGVETFDTRKKIANEMSHFESLREEVKSIYRISLNETGEVVEDWKLEDGLPTNSGVFDIEKLQIKFPEKNVSVDSEWTYYSNFVSKYSKLKFQFRIKEISNKEICIGFESTLETDDLRNNTKAYGEYILDKSSCSLIYARVESSTINGNTDILEIEKK